MMDFMVGGGGLRGTLQITDIHTLNVSVLFC